MVGCICIGKRPASPGETVRAKAVAKEVLLLKGDAQALRIARSLPAGLIAAVKDGGDVQLWRGPAPATDEQPPLTLEDHDTGAIGPAVEELRQDSSSASLAGADEGRRAVLEEAADGDAAATGASEEAGEADVAAQGGAAEEAAEEAGDDAAAAVAAAAAPSRAQSSEGGEALEACSSTAQLPHGCSYQETVTDAADAADATSTPHDDQPSAAAAGCPPCAAVEADGAASSAASGRSSFQEPAEEGSQAALLGCAEEVSLKQPRLSQLSSFFACGGGGRGGDGGARLVRPQGSPSRQQAEDPPKLDFTAAAAELVLLPRCKLLPLTQPEQALADAADMLGRQATGLRSGQEVPALLAALLTLRRVAIHHPALLGGSMGDVAALLQERLHGGSAALCLAAVLTLLDLLASCGGALLRNCEGARQARGCLLGLLLAASGGRTAAIRFWANEALRHMAEQLHQGRVIRLLEPFLEHPLPPVRSKAAEWLMVATYRKPDGAAAHRPASPPAKWRE